MVEAIQVIKALLTDVCRARTNRSAGTLVVDCRTAPCEEHDFCCWTLCYRPHILYTTYGEACVLVEKVWGGIPATRTTYLGPSDTPLLISAGNSPTRYRPTLSRPTFSMRDPKKPAIRPSESTPSREPVAKSLPLNLQRTKYYPGVATKR